MNEVSEVTNLVVRRESLMTTLNPAVARVLERLPYPLNVMLTCIRW